MLCQIRAIVLYGIRYCLIEMKRHHSRLARQILVSKAKQNFAQNSYICRVSFPVFLIKRKRICDISKKQTKFVSKVKWIGNLINRLLSATLWTKYKREETAASLNMWRWRGRRSERAPPIPTDLAKMILFHAIPCYPTRIDVI